MNLSFTLDEEDNILNATIRDSDTGSVMYTLETPKYADGILTTTATRTNQIDGSTRVAFRILWKGGKGLEDATVVLNDRTREEVPIRDIFRVARGGDTFGSIFIEDVEYRWKTKGTGSKVVLVTTKNKTVAESHSKRRSSFFRKARDMGLEISGVVSLAVDVILLTFIFAWKERQKRTKIGGTLNCEEVVPLSPLPGEEY